MPDPTSASRRTPSRGLHAANPFAWAVKPNTWLRIGCIAVCVFSALQILMFAHGRDQTIYSMVADGILQGEMPYRDRWDFKPPGIFLVHTVALAVFGQNMWGVRVLEVLALVLLAASFVGLSLRFYGDRTPGYLAAALTFWVQAQLEFWHSGQPEIYGGMLTGVGLWLATKEGSSFRRQLFLWGLCGAAFGLAFLMKPPLGAGAIVCAAYLVRARMRAGDGWRASLIPLFTVGLASLLPIALAALWFWAKGALGDLAWTLFEFTPGYTRLGWGDNAAAGFYFAITSLVVKFSALLAVGACLALGFSAPVSHRERELSWLLFGIVLLHLAGIAMQAKFFQYHFSGTLPVLALFAGLGFFKLWRVALYQGGGGAVAFASLLVLVGAANVAVKDVPHGYAARCEKRLAFLLGVSDYADRAALDRDLYYVADYNLAANRDVAARIAALTAPTDVLYVWGFEPSLYQLSGRRPASRFIYNVPQRVQWERERALRTLRADLHEFPPQVVVVQRNDVFRFVTGDDLDSRAALEFFPDLQSELRRHFLLAEEVEDFQIYLRRPTS